MADIKGKLLDDDDLWDESDDNSQKDKFITFRIGSEDFGIELSYITEIVGIQKITEVPDMPAFLKGVINLRGRVIPVIDVRIRFGLEPRAYDDRTCVVVVNINETALGLIVDTVNEVLKIPADQVSPPPSVHAAASGRYIKGMGKVADAVKILLNVEKLLLDQEIAQLTDNSTVN